jgi:Rps23 Pro-64 3,4-dihydroxylase Tpa1-like proline 4-hydroxylase
MIEFTDEQRGQFAAAQPFPHLVVDGLWRDDELHGIAGEFPPLSDPRWQQYTNERERGKRAGGPHVAAALEHLTGIHPLIADELGGGMHLTGEGGRLGIHTDFQRHPDLPDLQRRINMLVFLSPDWRREWGGVLYLGADREVEIVPAWNRTVIFATSNMSWHGHPDPIVGNHTRMSLALYFYSPADDGDLADTTAWLE